jgi:hypothetical protein
MPRNLSIAFALVFLFLCGCQSPTPSLHLYVGNLSRLEKQKDVRVFFDNVSIFDSTVTFSPDEPYREYVTNKKFTKGAHNLYVTADSGNLKMTQPVTTNEDMWIFITYTQGAPADTLLDKSSIKEQPWLSAIDLDKSNPSVHIFISGSKPKVAKADAVYKQWAGDTSGVK